MRGFDKKPQVWQTEGMTKTAAGEATEMTQIVNVTLGNGQTIQVSAKCAKRGYCAPRCECP